MRTQHVVVALMEDQPGVLNRVVSLLRRRGFNIDSLAVGASEIPGVARVTLVVDGTTEIVEQVIKQLYKVVEVLKVTDISSDQHVSRELALIKVNASASSRSEIMQIVNIYRANIVDVAIDSLTVEATGSQDKLDSLVQLFKRFGIKEIARTGRVVMTRGSGSSAKWDGD